jgi:transcriptional regulator with XRE-family HTH domain
MAEVRNLFYVRCNKRMSLTELARQMELREPRAAGRSTLSEFENCRANLSTRSLQAAALVLEVPMEEILRKVAGPEKKPRGYAARFGPASETCSRAG